MCHRVQVAAGRKQGRLVDEIGDVRTNHPRRGTCNRNQVHVFCQWDTARVNLENGQATIPVRTLDHHAAVEATRTQERLIQAIGPVCSSNDDYRLARIETIHLNQQLVQGLLTFVVAIDAGTTLAADGIDFINKDDAGSCFLGLVEEVTHAARANTD